MDADRGAAVAATAGKGSCKDWLQPIPRQRVTADGLFSVLFLPPFSVLVLPPSHRKESHTKTEGIKLLKYAQLTNLLERKNSVFGGLKGVCRGSDVSGGIPRYSEGCPGF